MQGPCSKTQKKLGGYGNCRCCLAIGHHQHTFGIAEMDILMENLNLFLLSDPRLPCLLCSACVTSLEDIQKFRQKVIASEAELHQVLIQGVNQTIRLAGDADDVNIPSQEDPLDTNVLKTEEETTKDALLKETDDIDSTGSTQSTTIKMSYVKVEQNDIVQDHREHSDAAGTSFGTVKIEFDLEESETIDTPTVLSEEQHETVSKMDPLIRNKFSPVVRPANKIKYEPPTLEFITLDGKLELATENKKIRTNIILLLKHSTILPFRFTKTNYFRCFYCEEMHSLFKDLRNHTEINHKDGARDYTILKWLQARQTKIIHADISDTRCKICDEKIVNVDDLVNHLTKAHDKVYYDVKTDDKGPKHGVFAVHLDTDALKCHICDKEFRIYKHLTSHMSEHNDAYACPKCNKKFVTFLRYKDHLMRHDYSVTKCPDCDKSFKSKHVMRAHRYTMHVKKNRNIKKCEQCSETFSLSQQLKRIEHMEKVHGIKKHVYKCEFCEKSYYTMKSLHHHKSTLHIRKNELVCELCGYRTTIRRVMRNHMNYHNGVKNYECNYCHKKFATHFSRELHIRMHTNDKKFVCSLCDAAFIQKHCLKRHISSRHPKSGVDIEKL